MAKVQGPLMSLEARGKIGDAIVFFPWKGLHVVRQWLKPTNPKTSDQGDIRLALGALGRACSVIGPAAAYAGEVKLYVLAGKTWISTIVKYMIEGYMKDGTAFDVLHDEYAAHTAKTDFDTAAVALNLIEFDIEYKGALNLAEPGFMLYLAAKYATAMYVFDPTRFNRTPYTTALASWVAADITSMVAEFSV